MSIRFVRTETAAGVLVTSPDLPGWSCSASNSATLEAALDASLRAYLRHQPGLDPRLVARIEDELRS